MSEQDTEVKRPYRVAVINYENLLSDIADIQYLFLVSLTDQNASTFQMITEKLKRLKEEASRNLEWTEGSK